MANDLAPARAKAPGRAEYGLLAGVSLTWGASYMFTKLATSAVPPLTLIASRASIAVVFMFGLLALRRKAVKLTLRDIGAFALVGLTTTAAPLCLIAISVSYVHSSVTAITMALVPLITALLAIFRREYPTWRTALGIAVGLGGIIILFGPSTFASFGDSARGAVAAIAAAVIFSGSLFAAGLVKHHDPLTVTTASLTASVIFIVPLALIMDGVPDALPSTNIMLVVLVLALVNTAGSSILMFALVRRAGATFTSYNNYIVPAIAVMFGAAFLGEAFTPQSFFGVTMVLLGVAISTLRRAAAPALSAPPPG